MYQNPIRRYHLIDGAKEATGLVVIIDVFRAFSLECYLSARGAGCIRPVGSVEDALSWRVRDPDAVLIGERRGIMLDGFDFGNSPSTVPEEAVRGKTVIHTTSAGTQGIVNAVHADEILTGALVNAAAIARYIEQTNPSSVSLVSMGKLGVKEAFEDELCAEYIESILLGKPLPSIRDSAHAMWHNAGAHFFDPNRPEFPTEDFWLCTDVDRFDFVLRVERDSLGFRCVAVGGASPREG